MAARGKAYWIGWVISLLPIPLFIFSAALKVKGGPEVLQGVAHLGIPTSLIIPLAILEISCVVIYLIPRTAVLGAVLMTGYIGGAILAHLRIGEPVYLHIVIGIALWLGIYLREPRLQEVLPLRRPLRSEVVAPAV
jgi:hypothetical protein